MTDYKVSPLERLGYRGWNQAATFKKHLMLPLPYLGVIVKNYRDLAAVPPLLPGLMEHIDNRIWSAMSDTSLLERKYKVYGVPAPYIRDTGTPASGVKVSKLYDALLADITKFSESSVMLYMHSGFETEALRAASGLAKEALQKGVDVRMIGFGKFLELVKETFEKNRGDAEVKKHENARLLIVHTIGAEYSTVFTKSTIQSLLAGRRSAGLPTVLVSHLTPSEFEQRYETSLQAVVMKFEDAKITATVDELLRYMQGN